MARPSHKPEPSKDMQIRLNRESIGTSMVNDMREGRVQRASTFVDRRKEAQRRACRDWKEHR